MSAAPKRGLGRGLGALLGDTGTSDVTTPGTNASAKRDVPQIPVASIRPNPYQPRTTFAPEALDELRSSIATFGVLVPIIVRERGDGYELIAGERRWRALQKAGIHEALVVVKDVSPASAFELALIENVQREDLNPIELAESLDRLMRESGYTQEALAERLGKDRSTITNTLRLLKLPTEIRAKIVSGELSEGHGRALLGAHDVKSMEQIAEKVIRGRLSVRATEALVRGSSGSKDKGKNGAAPKEKSSAIRDLEQRLTRALGTKVEVRDQGNKGEVAIPYADLDQLDRILAKLL